MSSAFLHPLVKDPYRAIHQQQRKNDIQLPAVTAKNALKKMARQRPAGISEGADQRQQNTHPNQPVRVLRVR